MMLSHMLLARGATVPARSNRRPASFEEEVRANRLRELHEREAAQRARRPASSAPR